MWCWYMDPDGRKSKVGEVFVDTESMYCQWRIRNTTPECLEECCDLSIFSILPMKYRDNTSILSILAEKFT